MYRNIMALLLTLNRSAYALVYRSSSPTRDDIFLGPVHVDHLDFRFVCLVHQRVTQQLQRIGVMPLPAAISPIQVACGSRLPSTVTKCPWPS
ncbi:hypothetical protein MTO96_050136 [Rhipicephalus appendiculatus]